MAVLSITFIVARTSSVLPAARRLSPPPCRLPDFEPSHFTLPAEPVKWGGGDCGTAPVEGARARRARPQTLSMQTPSPQTRSPQTLPMQTLSTQTLFPCLMDQTLLIQTLS